MKKKDYIAPLSLTVKIEQQTLMAGSQFEAPVNPPTEEVEAEDALSRMLGNPFMD